MFHSEVALSTHDIYMAPGNQDDETLHQCQHHWSAEAIRYIYTHRDAVKSLFASKPCVKTSRMKPRPHLMGWPEFPAVKRLPVQRRVDYSLMPMLFK